MAKTKQRVCVYNLTRQSFLSLGVRVADTQWDRLRGLLGHMRLQGDDGLWVVPSQGIHTVGLLFPVDVVYLDASSRVIHLVERLGPFRIGPLRRRARSVLELPTESVFCSNTQIGDQFVICSPEGLAAHLEYSAGGRPGSIIYGRSKRWGSRWLPPAAQRELAGADRQMVPRGGGPPARNQVRHSGGGRILLGGRNSRASRRAELQHIRGIHPDPPAVVSGNYN